MFKKGLEDGGTPKKSAYTTRKMHIYNKRRLKYNNEEKCKRYHITNGEFNKGGKR